MSPSGAKVCHAHKLKFQGLLGKFGCVSFPVIILLFLAGQLPGQLPRTTNLNKLRGDTGKLSFISSAESLSTSSISIFAHHHDFESFIAVNNSAVP